MDEVQIGQSGFVTTRMCYGCMRITGVWNPADLTAEHEANAEKAVIAAYEAGYRFFDHADIYGQGTCEETFGKILRKNPEIKRNILIATKCGIRFGGQPNPTDPGRYDFSREHILWSCDQSLRRLGVDRLDIYQLHRPDVLMDPDEVAEAFDRLQAAGKVRYFGVSNFLPSTLTLLQSVLQMPLVVNQVEIHLKRLACFFDGTLDQCLMEGVTPLAWSPLAGGSISDEKIAPGDEGLVKVLDEVAKEIGEKRTTVALAWLMKHPSGIVPIVGTVRPERIRESVRADDVELTREQWYRLLVAARGEPMP